MAEQSGTPIGGVTVEIRAPIDRLSSDFAAAEARTRQADRAMQGALSNTTSATTNLARAQLQLIDAFNKGEKASVELVRAVGGTEAVTKLLTNTTKAAAEAQAVLAAAEKAQAAAAEQAAAAQTVEAVATEAATVAAKGHAIATSTVTREIIVMGREIGRGNFSRLAGSATILAQGLGLLTPELIAVTAGVVAVAAAAAYMVYAVVQFDAANQKATETAVGLGAASMATGAQLTEAATAAQSASNISLSAARTAADSFAAAGVSTQDTITYLTASVSDFATLTGQKTPEAVKTLAAAFADPAKGAEELNNQFHFLDDTELKNIQTLAAMGDKTAAQNKLAHDFYNRMNDAAQAAGGLDSFVQQLGRGFDRLSDAIGGANRALALFGTYGFGGQGVGAAQDAAAAARQAAIQKHAALVADATGATAEEGGTPEAQAEQQRQNLQGAVAKLRKAQAADQALGDTQGYQRATQALGEYTRALNTYLSPAEKAHQSAQLDIQLHHAKTAAQKGAIEAQKEALKTAGEVMSAEEAAQKAADAGAVAGSKHVAAHHAKRDAVADETAKINENTKALLAEAGAYLQADAAGAMRIEASRQAAEFAVTHPKANVAALTGQFLAEDVAKQANASAKQVAATTQQTAALKLLNDQVAAGTIPAAEEARLLKEEDALRPLEAALANASGDAKAKLTAILKGLKDAQAASNAESEREAVIQATDKESDKLANLQLELTLLGKTNRERGVAIAQANALKFVADHHTDAATPQGRAYVGGQTQTANAQADLANAQFVQRSTDAVEQSIRALQLQSATYGMTNHAAEAFLETQKLIDQALQAGLDLTPAEIAKLHQLGEAYATADDASKRFAAQQKATADASKYLGDTFETAIEGMVNGGKSLKDTLHSLATTLGAEALKGILTGEGSFAGALGTNKTTTQGGPNGGILSQLLGSALKQPGSDPSGLVGGILGGGKKPTGTQNDPIYTASATDAAGGGGGGFLGKLLGGLGGLGGGGGSPIGAGAGDLSSLAGLFHDSPRTVGSNTPPMRSVPSSIFFNAPRLHGGLASDEFPAILQTGEQVVPRGGAAGGGTYHMHVHGVTDTSRWQRSNRQLMRDFQEKTRAAR